MENKKGKSLMRVLLVGLFALSSLGSVLADEYPGNESLIILECIGNVDLVIASFSDEGFNVARLEDLKLMISGSYENAVAFDSVMVKCDLVDEINRLAFDSRDFIGALKLFYDETDKSNVNMSSVDSMIAQIDLEFGNERYEKIEELVDAAYEEIIDIQSTSSALKVFYSSTSNTIVSFFKGNYKEIIFIVVLSMFLYFAFRKKIKIKINHVKIRDRELRKEVIKDLIRKTQKEYFSNGEISEGMYSVRTKKFSEIVRGLDKEILGFKENLLNFGVKK